MARIPKDSPHEKRRQHNRVGWALLATIVAVLLGLIGFLYLIAR